MANTKITDLSGYTTPLTGDVLPIVDVANTTTKKITYGNLLSHMPDGTVDAPALAFKDDTDSGLYRIGDNNLGLAIGGVKLLDLAASAMTVQGALQFDASPGTEKVTNGSFTGSATGWTLGAAWGYNANAVDKNADGTTTLSQDVSAVANEIYEVVYTISNWTVGTVTVSVGGVSGTARGADDTYKEYITATGTGNLIFTPTNTARFTIDTVSVKRVGVATTDRVNTWIGDRLSVGVAQAGKAGLFLRSEDGTKHFLGDQTGIGTDNPLAPLTVGSAGVNNSVDAVVLISRDVDDSVAGNGHAFSDSSQITRSGEMAYNSFDARINISGTAQYDHYAGFQALPTYASSNSIGKIYGLYAGLTANAGTVDKFYGVYVAAPSGVGTITKKYGFVSEAGAGLCGFGTIPLAQLHVYSTENEVARLQANAASGYTRLVNSATGGGTWDLFYCANEGIFPAGSLVFYNNSAAVTPLALVGSNVGIGVTALGTDAAKVLGIGNGTAPSNSPADMAQLYSADQAIGNACLHTRTENGAVIKLYQCAKANYNNWAALSDVVNALVAIGLFDAA